ncbi:MAG: ABC transporter ATP-binding protein, partial [Oscillospiraceae bacterium]|nr:ABC transporter ATP-binding protein [Oscillospiraceae bacterium]
MLELNNIVKIYPSGGENIMALKGVNLRFRNNEFVSILGPSGCGKTTTLNIIGGLDQYTDGDLIINGRSTKEYKDRDWDTYRNHSIGFVFQSYNLIPHQTVLSNVELALTLSGVSKKERRERAKQALEAVGLGNQLRKRPAQMSGGQMQRVAIARAIVNDPDIILADEPTGALDSETSIQVMNILKEIAQDRLVVMVTHNPELAMEYSTRIVRMLDGNVISDSMPITEAELEALREEDAAVEAAGGRKAYAAAAAAAGDTAEGVSSAEAGTSAVPAAPIGRRKKKASMSLLTSFSLSLNNLFTKKGRTLLTAFAGSIGIIGIALIYAVSQGTNDYIDTVQEDTLSSYPLSITSEAADITGILGSFVSKREEVEALKSDGTVVEQAMLSTMLEGVGTNDLHSLKVYLEENSDAYAADVTNITYGYNITPRVYTRDCMGELLAVNPSRIMRSMGMNNFGMSIFSEMSNLSEKTISQYEMLQGRWPQEWNELILVLNDPNRISDLVTFAFGLHDPNELREMFEAVMNGKTPEASSTPPLVFTYDDLMAMDLRLIPMGDMYRRDEEHNVWENMSDDSDFMAGAFEGGEKLVITGIVTPIDDASGVLLSTGLNYLPSLPLHVMELASEHKIVKQQQADEDINVFSGKPFGEESEDSGIKFEDMITFDASAFSRAFNINFDPNSITPMLTEYLQNYAKNMNTDNSGTAKAFTDGFRQLATGMLNELVSKGGGTATVRLAETTGIVNTYLAGAEAKGIIQGLVNSYGLTADNYLTVYRPLLTNMLNNYILAHNEDLGPGEDPEEPDEPEEPVDPEDPDAPGEGSDDPAHGPSEEGGSSGSEPGEGGSGEGSGTPSTDPGTTPGGDSTGDGSSSGDSAGGSDSGSTSGGSSSGGDSGSASGGSSSGGDSGSASGGSSSGSDSGTASGGS